MCMFGTLLKTLSFLFKPKIMKCGFKLGLNTVRMCDVWWGGVGELWGGRQFLFTCSQPISPPPKLSNHSLKTEIWEPK